LPVAFSPFSCGSAPGAYCLVSNALESLYAQANWLIHGAEGLSPGSLSSRLASTLASWTCSGPPGAFCVMSSAILALNSAVGVLANRSAVAPVVVSLPLQLQHINLSTFDTAAVAAGVASAAGVSSSAVTIVINDFPMTTILTLSSAETRRHLLQLSSSAVQR